MPADARAREQRILNELPSQLDFNMTSSAVPLVVFTTARWEIRERERISG
jgi:hypothetical protein